MAAAPESVDFRSIVVSLVHEAAKAVAALRDKHCQTQEQGKENGQNPADSYPPRAARGRPSLPSLTLFGAAAGAEAEGDGSANGEADGTASPKASRSSALKGRDRFTRKGLESSLSPVSNSTASASTVGAASSAAEAPGSSRMSASSRCGGLHSAGAWPCKTSNVTKKAN